MNNQNPNKFRIDFNPSSRIWFDYAELIPALVSGIGNFDGEAVKQAVEEFWKAVFRDGKAIPVFRLSDDKRSWIEDFSQRVSILWLLRSGPFGILCPLPAKRPDAQPHLFLEFDSADDCHPQFSCTCHFSVRDETAALLPPIETPKSKTGSFSELLYGMTYEDGTPLSEDPGMIFRALGRICRPQHDVDLSQRLLQAYEENSGLSDDFLCVDTGFVLKSDLQDLGARKGSPIFLLLMKAQDPYFFFDRDFKIGIPCRECLPPLERYVSVDNVALSALAEKAESEDWSFVNDGGQTIPFGRLRYFLQFTFEKIEIDHKTGEDKVAPELVLAPDGVSELFCTGLLDKEFGLYIYAYCTDPDPESGTFRRVEWVSKTKDSDGNFAPHPILDLLDSGKVKNHGLPYPVNWANDPAKLVIQYRRLSFSNIEFNFRHIVFDNWKRIRHVFPDWSNAELPPSDAYAAFSTMLEKYAWARTRKMVAANYKVAIPVWYRGSIQLLLPLFLDSKHPAEPTVALVLSESEYAGAKRPYYAPTCLTLEMARNNARVIARVDETWLGGNAEQSAQYWLSKEAERETNPLRKELIQKSIDALVVLHDFDDGRSKV